ncbi:response regulator [Spirosoma aerophilum]
MVETKQVVIIDDDDDDCSFFQLGIDRWNQAISVNRFTSGDEFIHSKLWQKEQNKLNLILLELILPGEDGMDWLRLFLKHECCQNTPVVMYSCLNIDPDMCIQAGAADYINKPGNLEELDQVVNKICVSWLLV